MRLWSLNPKYLDSKGLVALWRESLLAQKVLKGDTLGYKNHPQLIRFKNHSNPLLAISFFLYYIYQEANKRNFNFNLNNINKLEQIKKSINIDKIFITRGQILYEFQHLKNKLKKRNPDLLEKLVDIENPQTHPLFLIREGDIANWEKI